MFVSATLGMLCPRYFTQTTWIGNRLQSSTDQTSMTCVALRSRDHTMLKVILLLCNSQNYPSPFQNYLSPLYRTVELKGCASQWQ